MKANNAFNQLKLHFYMLSKKHYVVLISVIIFCIIGVIKNINSIQFFIIIFLCFILFLYALYFISFAIIRRKSLRRLNWMQLSRLFVQFVKKYDTVR